MKRLCFFALIIIFVFTASNCLCANAVSISAKAAVVFNGTTCETVFAQNEHTRLPMASTTKIMTAYIICKYADLSEEITVDGISAKTEGTSLGLKEGDTVSYAGLVYGMLLPSGNDAANAAAIAFSGSIEAFVALMNDEAKKLNLTDTNFNTPSGLDGETHYTTAYDLGIITINALRLPFFKQVCSSKKAVIKISGNDVTLYNHNKFLSMYDGAFGVKTGYTIKSGRCLVTAVSKDGKFIVTVTLNDKNDWKDHAALSDYGLQNIKVTSATLESENYLIPIAGLNDTFANAQTQQTNVYFPTEADVEKTVCLPEFVFFPIESGIEIGKVVYSCDNNELYSIPIYLTDNDNFVYNCTFFEKVINYFNYICENI